MTINLPAVHTLVTSLLPVLIAHDASVTSWLRTPARNAAVGGSPHSRHLEGLGIDVVLDVMERPAKDAFMQAVAAVGYVAIDEGGHIHVQPDRRSDIPHVIASRHTVDDQ